MRQGEISMASILGLSKQPPDFVKHFQPRCRIAASRSCQRTIIDQLDLTDRFCAGQFAILADIFDRAWLLQAAANSGKQHALDQRRFSRTADAGDDAEISQRNIYRTVSNVVTRRSAESQPACRSAAGFLSHRVIVNSIGFGRASLSQPATRC